MQRAARTHYPTSRARTIALLLLVALSAPALAQTGVESASAAAEAWHRGRAWLVHQQGDNGAWCGAVGYAAHESYAGKHTAEHVGFTALAGLALLEPGRDGEGPARQAALDQAAAWLIDIAGRNQYGYFTAHGTRMIEHAYATLFFAEMQIRQPSEKQEEMLRRAVDLMVHSQGRAGGWCYQPAPRDSDVICTAPVLQALRAASRAGVDAPEKTWELAIDYLCRCRKRGEDGAFRYEDLPPAQSRISYACTAAGLFALADSGRIFEMEGLREGALFLKQHYDDHPLLDFRFFFERYYAVRVRCNNDPAYHEELVGHLRHDLIRSQSADGGWSDDVGPVYATAMACLILQECR